MINPSIVRTANRIRRRYAESFASLPHTRIEFYRTHGSHAPHALGYSLSDALREARAIDRAADLGLTCETESEDHAWDGDCPAPEYHLQMIVRDEADEVRASLGGIGVDSLDDPYLDTCKAELFAEAIEAIEAEREALIKLATRERIEALETLAREHIGASVSPLAFVTIKGSVAAVFVSDTAGAIAYARTIDPSVPCSVETSEGVTWDNPAAETLQRVDVDASEVHS